MPARRPYRIRAVVDLVQTLPRNEVASGKPLQMEARRLQFLGDGKTLLPRQLWGAVFGELK